MNFEISIPSHELFLSVLAAESDPIVLEMISFAYTASKYGHAGQIRDDGSRYFDHPKSAAWIYISELGGRDPRIICDLLLHDIREDTYLLSVYRIKLNFGKDIALDVVALTKLSEGKESLEDYIGRVIDRGPWAVLTKLCDRLHNIRSLGACTPEKILRQITETKEIVVPLLLNALVSAGGNWLVYAIAIEKKINEALACFDESKIKETNNGNKERKHPSRSRF